MRLNRKRIIIFVTLAIVIIFIGAIGSYITYQNTSRNIRADLLGFAESITSAINPDRVKTITASEEDISNPDYVRLNEQLEKVQRYLGIRGVHWSYLVFKRGDKYLFSADSVPTGQYGDSQPGDEYLEPPPELIKTFVDGESIVTGKYGDEWGEFVSAFIPIKDFYSNQLLAVAGFDIEYQYFQSQIYRQIKIPVIATILALMVYVLIFGLISRRLDQMGIVRESEDKFRLITEFALDPIIMMNEKGLITLWNKAAEKTYGFGQEEALGKSLHHLIIPPNTYDIEHSEKLKTFSQTGKSPVLGKVIEVDTINKAGKTIPIELSVAAVKINGQNFAIGIIRDISARKENEKKLADRAKQTEEQQRAIMNILEDVEEANNDLEKFKLAVENASDHIVITDLEGMILYANKAVEKITGFGKSEIEGKKAGNRELWGGQMPTSFYKKMWKVIKQDKKVFAGEVNNKRKDGQMYVAMASIAPVLDSKGKVVYFVGIERDITHEKEIDRMKTDFISLASHQLRTPLSAIRWFGEMLLNGDAGKLTKEQLEFVGNITMSNDRMIALVNSLLNISRIESGRIIVDPEPTDLGKLVNDVLAEIDNKIKEKKQKVIVSIHAKLPKIKVDPKLIREVYKNLLTNANKYTQEGGEITIIISKNNKEIVSQISDNGLGIPAGDQAKIYEKFYRAGNVVKLETEGTGLGLYLAKAIVDSSNGKIWFKSELKKGTTFWFTLPLTGVKAKKGEVTINS